MKRVRRASQVHRAVLWAATRLTFAGALLTVIPQLAADCVELNGGTLRWIVPARPGGGYDAYSRLLQPFLERALAVRIIIENRPEAGGIVGAITIRDAKPDGRTLGLINASGLLAANAVEGRTAPDPAGDFRILASVVSNHVVMFTGRDSGIGSLQQLFELARSRPIVAGVRDVGSASFYAVPVTAELLAFDYSLVTGYVGAPARTLAAIRGEVDVVFGHFDSLLDQVQAGELLPLLQLTLAEGSGVEAPQLGGAEGAARQRAAQSGRTPAQAEDEAAALSAVVGAGRLVVAPRELSEPLAACLDASLAQVLGNTEVAAAARRAQLGIEPLDGAEALREVLAAKHALPRFEPLIRAAVEQAKR